MTDLVHLDSLANQINEAHIRVSEHAHAAAEFAMKAGALLVEAKSRVDHGGWLPWLEKNCQFAERTAQGYMRIARKFPELDSEKRNAVADLPLRELLLALSDRNDVKKLAREYRQEDTEGRKLKRSGVIANACANNRDLDGGPYAVIYADPPWIYDNQAVDSRRIDNHYPTMPLDAICGLPVPEIAHKAAILFLWAPSPLIQEGLTVLSAWGFSYRTQFAWDKERPGMGYYVRNQHECLFIGVKGDMPTPPTGARFPSIIRSRRRAHSQKPDEAYEYIEAMYPQLPRIELFARNTRPGWAAWGNEVTT